MSPVEVIEKQEQGQIGLHFLDIGISGCLNGCVLDRAVDALHHAIRRRCGRLCQPMIYAVFGTGFVKSMVAAGLLVAPCKPIRKLKAIVSQDMGDVERKNAKQRVRKSSALAAVLWSYTLKYSRRLALSMATNR